VIAGVVAVVAAVIAKLWLPARHAEPVLPAGVALEAA
jgi:hypothetical protein